MNHTDSHIYNTMIAFRAPEDFLARFQQFSANVGRNRSAVARHLIARCLSCYENDQIAIAKLRQEIL